MNKDKKALIMTIGLGVIYAIVGVVAGGYIFDNIDKLPPAFIFLGSLGLLIFVGLGAGVQALAKLTRLDSSKILCYLPVAQDVVVYNVVKGIKTTNPLHQKLKNFNWLVTSTVMIILSCLAPVVSTGVVSKMLETSNGDETIAKILTINTTVIAVVTVVLLVAYIIRVLYFNYIFKLTYRSSWVRILAILPPFHLIFIAVLPNQISYILNTSKKQKRKK